MYDAHKIPFQPPLPWPVAPAPTNSNHGAPFHGGYYEQAQWLGQLRVQDQVVTEDGQVGIVADILRRESKLLVRLEYGLGPPIPMAVDEVQHVNGKVNE